MGTVIDPRAPSMCQVASPSIQLDAWWYHHGYKAADELCDGRKTINSLHTIFPYTLIKTVDRHLPGLSSPPYLVSTTQLRARAFVLTARLLVNWTDRISPEEVTAMDITSFELDGEMASDLLTEAYQTLQEHFPTFQPVQYAAPSI